MTSLTKLNKMKFFALMMGLMLLSFIPVSRNRVADEFVRLEGTWKGQLNYLDYSSNKNVEIAANLIVEKGKGVNTWYFRNEYPREPKSNTIDTLIISEDGKMIRRQIPVRERSA